MFSVSFTVINKYGKGGAVQISTVFCPPYMVLVEGSYEKGLLERFDSQRFSESVISDIHQLSGSSLFQDVQNLSCIWKMQKRNEEMFSLSFIIAPELAALNCLY